MKHVRVASHRCTNEIQKTKFEKIDENATIKTKIQKTNTNTPKCVAYIFFAVTFSFLGHKQSAMALQQNAHIIRPTFMRSERVSSNQEKLNELVYYATMAPSSHNTQCWRFRVNESLNTIMVFPDFKRRCPTVDPDDHHLYVSLGCAVENLVLAAEARGYNPQVDSSSPEDGIRVKLSPGDDSSLARTTADLFDAIPKRQVSRCDYDGKPISQEELLQLEQAGASTTRGVNVRVLLVTDRKKMNDVLDHVIGANTIQMNDPNFKKELVSWVRFNEKDAAARGDGLYGKCTDNPAIPTVIGKLIFNMVARASTENKKIVKQVESSAGFAIFVSERNDVRHWVETGRCYERFALRATTLGIRNAFLNQPVEVEKERPLFSAMLGLKESERADLIVRFGSGPEMPISPRRPLEDVVEWMNE